MGDEFAKEVREATRDLIDSAPQGVDWSALTEMGWFELHEEDPQTATAVLSEEVGRAAARSDALDAIVLSDLAAAGVVASISEPRCIVFYTPGRHATGTIDGTHVVDLNGIVRSSVAAPAQLLAPVSQPDGSTILVSIAVDDQIQLSSIAGVDPTLGLRRVRADRVSATVVADTAAAALLAGSARRATAHESIGLARRILDVAVEHVSSRQQFGRPIGSYQAVQHRLAEVEVAVSAATAMVAQSWEDGPNQALTILAAKALSAAALEAAVKHSLQVCGGMGFTEEFPLAPLVRRALFLSPFLGGASALTGAIGLSLVTNGTAPRLAGFAS